jgi:hypothetical protein
MFEFGRELKRVLGVGTAYDEPDPSLFELFDPTMLAAQAKACDVDAGRVSAKHPFPLYLRAAALWREHARRTGDPVTLRKAAASAQCAARDAETGAQRARAALEQALASILGADLFGDERLIDAAREHLQAAAEGSGDPLFEMKLESAFARLASREALAADDYSRALDAAALFDCVIHKLELAAHGRPVGPVQFEAVLARIERADLLAGFGVRMTDTRLLHRARTNLAALLESLDPDYEPLAWARAAEVLGGTLVSLGDLEGYPEHIAEGVSTLAVAGERFTCDHSPLDWARRQHALGVALQALAELNENGSVSAFEEAEHAFDAAAEIVGNTRLAMRATVANNRAACLARRAECCGDEAALGRAEAAFKAEIAATNSALDPVCWAVLQVNLARVYEARAALGDGFPGREGAVYALEEALDVFCDLGLKGLAETASAGLERVRVSPA